MQFRYELNKAALIQGARLQTGVTQAATFGAIIFTVFFVTNLSELIDRYEGSTLAEAILLWGLVCAACGTAFALAMVYVLVPMRVASVYRQNPTLYGAMELSEDDEGVAIQGPRMLSRFAWSDFRGFKENGKIFLLCLSKSIGHAVPKQDLSDETIRQFRSKLEQKLPRLSRARKT
jgi:hypothetical protein